MPTLIDHSTVVSPSDSDRAIAIHELRQADFQHVSQRYWRWLEIFNRDPQARVTQHPDYVLAEAAGTPTPLALCEASRGGEIVAVGVLASKTMTLKQAGGCGGTRMHGYRLVGNRWLGQTDDGMSQQLLAACDDFVRRKRAAFLLIEDLEQHDPQFAAAQLLPNLKSRIISTTGWQERLKIEFPPQPAEYWAKFSSKTRNTFKRKQKKIGATRLVRVSEPEQVADFLETAHAISQRTWQSLKLGLRIRNDESEVRQFTLLATLQALRSYLLFVNDRPAAFMIGTQHNGLFSYEEVGYDREFAELSPGQVLLMQVLEDLLQDNPPRVFDFGGGDADYKRLFATARTTSGTVLIVPRGPRGQLLLAYLRACRSADRTLRAIAQKMGLTTLLRQWIRGKRANISGDQP